MVACRGSTGLPYRGIAFMLTPLRSLSFSEMERAVLVREICY